MIDTDTTTAVAPHPAQVEEEPRWPCWPALVTTWLMPARTARRTGHLSLGSAFVLHLVSALLAAMLIVALVALSETASPLTIADLLAELANTTASIVQQFEREALVLTVVVIIIAAAIETAFLALAFLLMPWGACDERAGESYRHALRRTWLHTPHALPAILLVGIVFSMLDRSASAWYSSNPWPTQPTPPATANMNSQEWDDYWRSAEYREYRRLVEAHWRSAPWYVRSGQRLAVPMVLIVLWWGLWALLRGVGASRQVPPVARPPMCENCGYSLISIPMESRCPECGEAVARSLGSDARPGTVWEHARGADRWVAWWHCSVEAVRNPANLGRRLRAAPARADHRWLWVMHIPFIFLLAPAGFIVCATISEGLPDRALLVEFFTAILPGIGSFTACVLLFLGLFAAAVVGTVVSLRHERNLLPYSMQIVSYLSGFLVLWTFFASTLGVLVVYLSEEGLFLLMEDLTGIYENALAFFTWFLPNVAWGIWYFVLVARGTGGARYANR